jgi:hypothetical protein
VFFVDNFLTGPQTHNHKLAVLAGEQNLTEETVI